MARNFARISVSIWQDDDWRDLPPAAQHLYLILWSYPTLSYCGVLDWRPAKLSALAGDWTKAEVEAAADCLEARLFLVIDTDTEEALIRSWAKHDGLLKEPRMAVSFANAYATVASKMLRGVIVHEAINLHAADPTMAGWSKPAVMSVLTKPSVDPAIRALPEDPFGPGFPPVSGAFGVGLALTQYGVKGSPTPSPTPTPYSSSITPAPAASDEITPRRKPEIRLPATWTPTDAHRAQATERRCDLTEQVQAFRNHADTNDRRARNWNAAFTTWLGKSRPSQAPGRGTTDQRVMDHLALADRMQAEDDAQHNHQIGA